MILSNGIITLEVAGHGAEPVSLVKDGRDCIHRIAPRCLVPVQVYN